MRKELIILQDTHDINKIKEIIKNDIGSIYIYVDKYHLSETKQLLIDNNYTTRLFVSEIDNILSFYVYGKKKGNKGVFNQHCKNAYLKDKDPIPYFIISSSNINQKVYFDTIEYKNKTTTLHREFDYV